MVLDGDDGDETKGEERAVYRLHLDMKGLKQNKFILNRKWVISEIDWYL